MMEQSQKFRIVGVGGSGCYAVSRMGEEAEGDYIAMNTDAASLLSTNVKNKVLLGKSVTRGRSTGNDMALGERAAQSSVDQIRDVLRGAEVTFIIASVGGGTGAGAAPIVAQVARSLGSFVISFVTLPFSVEGKICRSNAQESLKGIRPFSDLVIALQNDKFIHTVHEKSMGAALKDANHMVLEAVQGVARLISSAGLTDLRPVLTGYASIAHGKGDSMEEATIRALDSPLLYGDITQALGVLLSFRVDAGSDEDISECMRRVNNRTNPSTRMVWTKETLRMEGVELVALFTGVGNPYLGG